jgi:cytochrome b involved in lipid metabolism
LTRPDKVREKVMVKPGFHLSDWIRLAQALSSKPLRKITLEELATHNSQYDCWTAYKGKVYDVTQYLHYHPGGVQKLMLGAGKDCTAMYDKFHPWVNAETMLGKCIIGTLVVDPVVEGVNSSSSGSSSSGGSSSSSSSSSATTTAGSVFRASSKGQLATSSAVLSAFDGNNEEDESEKATDSDDFVNIVKLSLSRTAPEDLDDTGGGKARGDVDAKGGRETSLQSKKEVG